jgi:hypothetical protein
VRFQAPEEPRAKVIRNLIIAPGVASVSIFSSAAPEASCPWERLGVGATWRG